MIVAIGIGTIMMVVFGAIKSTDVYRRARATAEKDPRVIEVLGSPVHAGLWVSGNVHILGSRGEADIEFPIRGSKEQARVHAVATRDRGGWHYSELTVRPRNAPAIDLLKP